MKLGKIKIVNFTCFEGEFILGLNEELNILVGNNEAGKSTILEAIHIALTGTFNGRNIGNELTQYLFNTKVVQHYLESCKQGAPDPPPFILIEVFFKECWNYYGLYGENKY